MKAGTFSCPFLAVVHGSQIPLHLAKTLHGQLNFPLPKTPLTHEHFPSDTTHAVLLPTFKLTMIIVID